MSDRRVVRVSTDFFDQLDGQLGAERGPAGEPSATDFIVFDLPTIVERFAMQFDDLPEAVEGVTVARVVVGTGEVVRAFVVYGLLLTDGVIELIGVDIESPYPAPRQTTHRSQTDHRMAVFDGIRRHRPTPQSRPFFDLWTLALGMRS